jgi:hypothetical protein
MRIEPLTEIIPRMASQRFLRTRVRPAPARARRLSVIAAASALVAGGSLALAPAAEASITVSGYVTCVDGLNVEGVWIQAGGGSGFANWSASGVGYYAHYSRAGISGSWTVHVGCGGSASNWKYTPDGFQTVTGSSASWTCYTPDDGTSTYGCQLT